MRSSPAKNTSKTLVLLVILVVAVVVVAVGIWLLHSSPAKDTINGTATITGFFAGGPPPATAIKFTSAQGQVYTANVYSGVYSITLPNGNIYGVEIDYTTHGVFGASAASCNAGSLNLDGSAGTYTEDWSC